MVARTSSLGTRVACRVTTELTRTLDHIGNMKHLLVEERMKQKAFFENVLRRTTQLTLIPNLGLLFNIPIDGKQQQAKAPFNRFQRYPNRCHSSLL